MRLRALQRSLLRPALQPGQSPLSASSASGCPKLAVRHRLTDEAANGHISPKVGVVQIRVVPACGDGHGRSARTCVASQEGAHGLAEVCARCAGARPYMEDRHTIVANFQPSGPAASAMDAGVQRSFAGVYDGHNGAQTAEEAAARCALKPLYWCPDC